MSLTYAIPAPIHASPSCFPACGRVSLMTALAGLLAAGLFVYLIYALVKPERF
ncbi:K(+)-transporting ATPase subunit F [Paraburkholderia sp. EG287A]|uniref:K(+)-transporting ATPase subunit F n=1 Tax=unclassified Paraburkholderia TaxID=2615204 RepID=UPI0034D1E5F9